jgi:DNA-binding PadR family transcriptional regulator
MDYYRLTDLGKQAIPELRQTKNDEELMILSYLDLADRATAEQIAYALKLDSNRVQEKLKSCTARRWVNSTKTKLSAF